MKSTVLSTMVVLVAAFLLAGSLSSADLKFVHHFIDRSLPTEPGGDGNYGLTALADIDQDGDLDFILGGRAPSPERLYWYEFQRPGHWVRHVVGIDYRSDVGLAAFDVDRNGWIAHENIPFGRTGPYGICLRTVVADLDGDEKKEIVMADADIEDSRVVILRNEDGKGGRWSKVELLRSFTYGSLHSLAVADLDGDGRPEIIVNEQEELLPEGRENPRWVVWRNQGQGRFSEHILLDQRLGGHELQVGDVDGDGDIDICSKLWDVKPWNGAGGSMHVDFMENLLKTRSIRK